LQRRLDLLPRLLLLAVAALQLGLVQTAGLTPWLGGGFGMFSTTRVDGHRHVHVFQLRPGLEREIAVPPELRDRERRVRALPSRANLEALGRALATAPSPDHGPAIAMRVQVWETRYAASTLVPSGHLLRDVEVPLAPAR
jgi:hypothetical protein